MVAYFEPSTERVFSLTRISISILYIYIHTIYILYLYTYIIIYCIYIYYIDNPPPNHGSWKCSGQINLDSMFERTGTRIGTPSVWFHEYWWPPNLRVGCCHHECYWMLYSNNLYLMIVHNNVVDCTCHHNVVDCTYIYSLMKGNVLSSSSWWSSVLSSSHTRLIICFQHPVDLGQIAFVMLFHHI
jgi:hypothetical protein